MHTSVSVAVECRRGHGGEELPQILFIGERRIEVAELLDLWPGRDHRYFKIRGSDGAVYILRHETLSDEWKLTPFEHR
jgi:hypothetical protein